LNPHYERIPLRPTQSFRAEEWKLARFDSPWHFHPEIELTYIVSSSGQRLVGDSLEPFSPGDLVLLGPEVPHVWQNPGIGPAKSSAVATVIQFRRDFIGPTVWDCPELAAIGRLIARASRGLAFSASTSARLAADIRRLPHLQGITALTALLSLLGDLAANTAEARPLCSLNYAPALNPQAGDRIARVITYASRHLADPPSLPELARVAAMTPSSFSRYFKRATGRSPSDFLIDLRISQSARLLRETDQPITRIAGEVGFTSLTSFNRRFKERMLTTPRAYRQSFT
jgi:AraC-like DNA-binding protein